MDLQLRNDVAVIVGGASGIGRATAELFSQEGAKVIIWDQVPPASNPEPQPNTQDAASMAFYPVDITDRPSLQRAFDETVAKFGHIDHVAHTAAIGSGKYGFPYTNLTPDDWPRILQVNVLGMVNVAHLVGPHLRESKNSKMIF